VKIPEEYLAKIGMFAVAGGAIPVLPTFEPPERLWFGVALRTDGAVDFGFVGVPPYFSNSCCVVLYFVAVLSLSIAVSRCFCNPLRLACSDDIR
jgi:hypothetical protein